MPFLHHAESEAAKAAAIAELEAFAQERITAGDNVSEVNAKLSAAKAAVYAARTTAEVTSAKNAGLASMKPTRGYENGYEWVDLGLPSGTKWATCNVGASSPDQTGLYFALGETTGYVPGSHEFTEENYSGEMLYYGNDIRDCNIDLAHDAARANMGGSWRIPTGKDLAELMDNCTCQYDYYISSPGNSCILLTSNINGEKVILEDVWYIFHTSSYSMGNIDGACQGLRPFGISFTRTPYYNGASVRAVIK